MKVALVYDLGSTWFRAALISEGGESLALVRRPAACAFAATIGEEADPEHWWQEVLALTAELLSAPVRARATVSGIAISAFTRTQVFLGADGRSLRPALTWRDGRATEEAMELAAALPLGAAQSMNAFHPVARLLWIRRHEPNVFSKLRQVAEPKDYLNARLTGRIVTDEVTGARLDDNGPGSGVALLCSVAIDPAILPPAQSPYARVGTVRPGLPPPLHRLVGVPVYTASMDTWCAALGLGANLAGRGYIVSGTTEACGLISAERRDVDGLVTLPWGDGLFQSGGPSNCGAGTLNWVAARVGLKDWGEVLAAASPEDMAATSLLFFPYLEGERVPLWEPQLRGAFVGLDGRHGARNLLLAAIRSLAFIDAQILRRAAGERLDRIAEIRIGGGPAQADPWCQLRADVLGRAISRPRVDEPGLLGCAILVFADGAAAAQAASTQAAMVSPPSVFLPRVALHARYEWLYAQFVALQPALIATGRALAAADDDGPISRRAALDAPR